MCRFKKLSERTSHILKILLTIFNFIVLLSNIACVIYFSVQLNHDLQNSYIIEYKRETCIPVSSEVISFKCGTSSNKWVPIWTDERNRTMIMDPFGIKAVKSSAVAEMQEIDLMSRQQCMCRSNSVSIKIPSDCQIWDICIFNTMLIEYLQRDFDVHYRTNVSFIVSSLVSTILSIVTLPLSVRLYKQSGSTYIELK